MKRQLDGDSAGAEFSPWLHRIAVATACAVFPLIIVGAGVTSRDAGMAFSDWPTSSGHLLNPPQWWTQDDTRWEHGHRLMGWAVGVLAMVLAVLSWRRGGPIRALGLATLIAIAIQGVLGGLRVNLVANSLAVVHGISAQVCLCLAATTALMTAPQWFGWGNIVECPVAKALQRLCVVGVSVVFLQLVFGAALRHIGGNHALLAHLLWSLVVVLVIGWVAMWVIGHHADCPVLVRLGGSLAALLIVQLFLGGMAFLVTVKGGSSSPLARWALPSAHVATGALLLTCSVLLALAASHMLRPVPMLTKAGDLVPRQQSDA